MRENMDENLQLIGGFVVSVAWHALPFSIPLLTTSKNYFLAAVVCIVVFFQIIFMTWRLYIHD